MNVKAIALGAVVGFVIAIAPSCGTAKCSTSNCDGCCDTATNTCVKKPASNNNTTCGASGNSCTDCTASSRTCNAGQCVGAGTGGGSGNTGGGSGGGGSGNTGGGSGGTCTGCKLPSGTCIPLQSTTNLNCGIGGAACTECATGQVCNTNNGSCYVPSTTKKVGETCTADADCAAIGAGARCKLMTTSGNASYPSGYCTKTCGSGSACPSGSSCINIAASPQYGENESICWDNCATGDACRTGYGCYTVGSINACWLDPLPTIPGTKTGDACTANAQCDLGGGCLDTDYNRKWAGGYCTRGCNSNTDCQADGGAICIGGFDPDVDICVDRCSTPGGQAECRAGYTCQGYFFGLADGGTQPSTDGFCVPPEAPVPTSVGAACTTDSNCEVPTGAIAECLTELLPDGGASGFPGGQCIKFDCSGDDECSPDGGALCLTIDANGNTACFPGCNTPGTGRGNCRAGYVCAALTFADGGIAPEGVCDPACTAPGQSCGTRTCNTTTGYCQ